MRRRKALSAFLGCILLVTLLSACTPKEQLPLETTKPPSPTASETEEPDVPSGEIEFYTFEPTVYAQGDIVIKYPQIVGDGGGRDVAQLNKLIEEAALRDVSFMQDEPDSYMYEIRYEVSYNSPQLISVLFIGYSYASGAAHPNNFLHTLTLDTERAEPIRLSGLVVTDAAFAEAVKNGWYTLLHEDITEEHREAVYAMIEDMGEEMWLERLRYTDDPTAQECSYLTESALGISISVPHVLGGHIEILLDYGELDPYRAEGSLLPQGA
ncbi:MAG TPA: DUF4163 domain-containing protein [Papillibacter sp.]|nr:DUF4163 domain-containing protein [Papillibacter sp.]